MSRWLLGLGDPASEPTLKETRTIRLEETTLNRVVTPNGVPAVEDTTQGADRAKALAEDAETEQHANRLCEKAVARNLFKRGKAAPSKKKPGKLPPRPDAQSKDSREAAADILREMTRRR